ncbi:MAG: hypothetical protein AAGI53_09445 [Planctomycetota bacterium]
MAGLYHFHDGADHWVVAETMGAALARLLDLEAICADEPDFELEGRRVPDDAAVALESLCEGERYETAADAVRAQPEGYWCSEV